MGTPAASGLVSTQYLMSFVSMLGDIIKNGITPVLYTLAQESLLPRGRNHLAQVCMRDKYDKLFFIDADSGWGANDFLRLCMSPFPVVAGTVPLKTYPIVLNYLPFKEDEKYFDRGLRTPEATKRFRQGKGMAEIPVAFVGTAFLCVDSQVFFKLSETEATYCYPNPYTGEQETHWDFFGPRPVMNQYYSEDWMFCHKVREAGYDVRINADVVINHVGTHTYRVAPNIAVDQAPEVYRALLQKISVAGPDQLIHIEKEIDEIIKDVPEDKKIYHGPKVHSVEVSLDK